MARGRDVARAQLTAAKRELTRFEAMENTAAVAVDAPDTAANPAVAITDATASPPGIQPSHLRDASNRDWVIPFSFFVMCHVQKLNLTRASWCCVYRPVWLG